MDIPWLHCIGLGPALAVGQVQPVTLHSPRSVGDRSNGRATKYESTKCTASHDMFEVPGNEGIASCAIHELPLRLADLPTDNFLASRVTVLVFTSPVSSNPSLEMIFAVIESLKFMPGLSKCPLLVTCDGPGRVSAELRPKKGFVTEAVRDQYASYVERLQKALGGTQVLVLPEREGFGRAVNAAIQRVRTPFVLICQHDNMFVRSVDLRAVVRTMEAHPDILKCVHFVSPKTTFEEDAGGVAKLTRVQDRLGTLAGDVCSFSAPPLKEVENRHDAILLPHKQFSSDLDILSLSFWPMPSWLERNHISSTAHYRDFVLGPHTKLKPGQFIEETFGQAMRRDLANGGSHFRYGIYRLLDSPESATLHLDGRAYKPVEEVRRRGWRESDLYARLEQQHQAAMADYRSITMDA